MALRDLSLVTETLVKLVDESIRSSPEWPAGQTPDVNGLPPDRLEGENAVGIYLYHLTEEAGLKNAAWPGRPQPPIRFSPMGLSLFYVLSAASSLGGTLGPYREQLLMGLAVKALHDWPVVDESTVINGVSVLHANLHDGDNRLKIELRHVPPGEAVSYWTAGSHPLRLSAYYEVRVVLLEPEEPDSGAGRVLLYGIQTFAGSLPRLETSRSRVAFQIPNEPTPRSIAVQPAQVVPGDGVTPGDELTLIGLNLAGDSVSLLIRASTWDAPIAVDPAWGVVAGTDRVFATPRTTASGTAVLPGIYSASVKITRQIARPDGTTGVIERLSNETPFTVVPAVTAIGVPVAEVFTVTGHTFQHVDLLAGAVEVYIADARLAPGAAGSLQPAHFAITSPTAIEMRLPAGASPGSFLPVRVLVNGAESPPRWVQVP